MRAARRLPVSHRRVARRSTAAVALALVAVAALAPTVAADAPDWNPAVNVRTTGDVSLQDADFSNRNVAIAWHEPGAGPREVGIRTSTNSGTSFGPTSFIPDARQPSVDICGGSELNAVYAHKVAPGNWVIERAAGSIDGDGFLTSPVSPILGIQRFPDVACAGGRVFVSWFEPEGNGDHLRIAHARRTDGFFEPAIDLGFDGETRFGARSLAVAGASNVAHAVFTRTSGDLRYRRWTVGDGPGFTVTPFPTEVIGVGNTFNSADGAVIAAAGDKVAAAWFKCGGIFARVSNDRGATWGPAIEVLDHVACGGDFATFPLSIAIRGQRIVIAYDGFGLPSAAFVGLIRTTNDFATWTDDEITQNFHDQHLLGYVTVGGVTRIAAAFDVGDQIRFRRQE